MSMDCDDAYDCLVAYLFGHIISTKKVLNGYTIGGLTYGGGNLWYEEAYTPYVYEIDPSTFAVQTSWAHPGDGSGGGGLAYQSVDALWIGDKANDKLYEVTPSTGVEVNNYDLAFDIGALCFDGTDLWLSNEDLPEIYRYSTAYSHLQTIPCPFDGAAYGLTYVDPYLYAIIRNDAGNFLAEIVPASGRALRVHPIPMAWPSHPCGLTWDGTYLRHGLQGESTGAVTDKSTISSIIKG